MNALSFDNKKKEVGMFPFPCTVNETEKLITQSLELNFLEIDNGRGKKEGSSVALPIPGFIKFSAVNSN